MGYIANSAFTAGGVKYRPGANVPELDNISELVNIGYVVDDGIPVVDSEVPSEEIETTDEESKQLAEEIETTTKKPRKRRESDIQGTNQG